MINFMRYRLLYLLLSLAVILPGIFYLLKFGFRPAIDFTGGTLLELKLTRGSETVSVDEIQNVAKSQNIEISSLQSTDKNTYLFKLKSLTSAQNQAFIKELTGRQIETNELRYETVGPTLGKELLQKTLIASIIAICVILFYIAWTFKNIKFGVAAIVALIHDLLVVISVFSILGRIKGVEVDSLFVTAILTTMSFSVHDTIVVFDRIRESLKKSGSRDFESVINQALTETMGRSLNNSLTIIFMLQALFLLGGETVKWFVLALLVGTISGTYSSPFVATPILYTWQKLSEKRN